jgi:glycosyltransferase involved in cell wall biosynthesis
VILFKKNVYHDVIGGNLGKEVERYSSYRRFLNSFQKNWVETSGLKRELEELGITNVEVIPNFRSGYIVPESELVSEYCEPYRFCTFSRVTKEKGITTAINAIKEINQKRGRTICTLDIYGAVDDAYKTEFDKLIADVSGVIKYKGVVNPDDSVNVIRNYYGTLFPTLWIGEGIAGTIIESFFAGVPVLATDWRYNSEVIECGVNGITYPCEAASSLVDAIYWLISVDNILEIKKECTKAAEYYLPDDHIDKITNEIMKD